MTTPTTVSRRDVPGTKLRASSIGFRIDPPSPGGSVSEPRRAALLANARARGITTYDVGQGASARRAERLLGAAFPTTDPDLLFLVHRSAAELVEEGTREHGNSTELDLEARLRRSLEPSAERLRPQSIGLLVWHDASERSVPSAEVVSALDHLVKERRIAGWGRWVPSGSSVSEWAETDAGGAELLVGSLSPLDPSFVPQLTDRASRSSLGFFAEDPLGSGRLDGTRFARSIVDRRPDARPLNVRELRREFDPVLRLGFLTEGKQRTLAQASLKFVLRWPWVSSALVPLPAPERLDELLAAELVPDLTETDVERILVAAL
jgi:aryl-alcohol dehydrogenase-like predicted oxidoreductase